MIGNIVCELPPSKENSRNSEGAFIVLKDGRLLFAWSRYGAVSDDGAAADIYAMISEDEGETWGAPFILITRQEVDAHNIMSVSFMRMQNEDMGMFFLKKKNSDCVCMFVRSADEGETWSAPVVCSEPEGYFVVNNDRIVRANTGRILIPAAKHELKITINEDGSITEEIIRTDGELYVFASDDDGYTFRTIAEHICIPVSSGLVRGVQEPGLLQLDEKKIWCYIRNDSCRQYECFSEDDGATWTQPLPSQFTSDLSPLCAKRLMDGRIIAVWNPIPVYPLLYLFPEVANSPWSGERTPLTLAISSDNGKSFPQIINLETEKQRGYCYTAIHETTDNSILLAYCAGGIEDGGILCRLRIRKISLDELQ